MLTTMEKPGMRFAEDASVIIRLTSTMTPDDENVVASALFKAMVSILDLLPLTYALNIETSVGQNYRHSHPTAPNGARKLTTEPAPATVESFSAPSFDDDADTKNL